MKAIVNSLNVKFNYVAIDSQYDFFTVTTTDKYISGGAYILDKPVTALKAESVSFDGGRSLFVMFKKNTITLYDFVEHIEDEKLSVKKIKSTNIKDYVLFRLFLFSLNNFENDELKFNNITGKLFIYSNKWMRKDRAAFKTLSLKVNSEMNFICEAVSFALFSKFSKNKKVKDYAKYELSNKNNALKRVLQTESKDNIYIKHALNGRKAELSFLNISPEELHNNKVYYIYYVLDLLKNKFDGLFELDFATINMLQSIGTTKGNAFIEKAIAELREKPLNFVNMTKGSEYADDFRDLVGRLSIRTGINGTVSDKVKSGANNIILIHNKEYYEQNGYEDPHTTLPHDEVVQCVTVEDSLDKILDDKEAIINTIIKEVAIKNDILFKHSFSLDDWQSYGFDKDWVLGKESGGRNYFMIVHPNGEFEFSVKLNDFKPFADKRINEISKILSENKGKEKTVVADADGNINVFSRTDIFTLPNKEIFGMDLVSRSKESRETNLAGLVDINLFEAESNTYFNVGIRGYGMNTNIPHAPLLYKVDKINNSKNLLPSLMETMSVEFVKYKSFTVLPYPMKYLNEWILVNDFQKSTR
ncbi:MAG: hypothetical protein K2M17_01195 [Bacilli bacterium]|nr:hypothetical protein [Bacilli bacterium]